MRLQIERLASSILRKSPRELAEIAKTNPAIYWEWMAEIQKRSDQAREEAQVMAQALQWLARAPGKNPSSHDAT